MYQGGSDSFSGPRDPILAADEAFGIDMEGEIAVVTGDVPIGISPSDARHCVLLVMLVNDVSLRNLIPEELAKGFGFFQSKPASAFSPVAVTPDELGAAWDGGRLHHPLRVDINGKPFGRALAGEDMTFDFRALIAHAAKTRPLIAGSIIGSGTVSNKDEGGGPGRPVTQGGRGYSCIAEIRMVETIRDRRGDHTLFALRRQGADRDARRQGRLDLWSDRADRRAIQCDTHLSLVLVAGKSRQKSPVPFRMT